ncbi:MAG: DUF4382 domain-containing protein [Elainellaceae cyanobacterium]
MKRSALLLGAGLLAAATTVGCGNQDTAETSAPAETDTQAQAPDSAETGTLELVANGEDFVRQGFVTRDGWQVDFEHVYVNLSDVTAYQTDPAFDPDSSEELQATEEVTLLAQPQTVDLAEGGEDAAPISVTTEQAPAGTYNALHWELVEADQGPAEGSTILLVGTAEKEGQTVDFNLSFDPTLEYTCGQYVGAERKGILQGDEAEVETTFHFDHVFGDGEAPADDPINTAAVGFDPFANLAQDGTLTADMAALEQQLPSDQYQTLQQTLAGLGHVGEGHCRLEGDLAQADTTHSPE